LGDDQCHVCFTPGVKYDAKGNQVCLGCGKTPIRVVTQFLEDKALGWFSTIEFIDATLTYERSPFASRISFGEWLCNLHLKLLGRP
jgi:hypothetical protein